MGWTCLPTSATVHGSTISLHLEIVLATSSMTKISSTILRHLAVLLTSTQSPDWQMSQWSQLPHSEFCSCFPFHFVQISVQPLKFLVPLMGLILRYTGFPHGYGYLL